jgi:hypothetical protein
MKTSKAETAKFMEAVNVNEYRHLNLRIVRFGKDQSTKIIEAIKVE